MIVLPPQIIEFATTNGFQTEEELKPGFCSRIFRNGSRILKYPFQGEEVKSGATAALELQKAGGPTIFALHSETGSLIMEYVSGGMNLLNLTESPDDEVPFVQLAKLICTLNPKDCLSLSQYYGEVPDVGDYLIKTTIEIRFLHGDLHHENILYDPLSEQYRPIDPKGLVGDPAYECVAFLRNPIYTIPKRTDLYKFTRNRILRLSDSLGFDPFRIAAWLYVDRYVACKEDSNDPSWRSVLPIFKRVMDSFPNDYHRVS